LFEKEVMFVLYAMSDGFVIVVAVNVPSTCTFPLKKPAYRPSDMACPQSELSEVP
jgi:hypothetical protein